MKLFQENMEFKTISYITTRKTSFKKTPDESYQKVTTKKAA